MIKELKKITKIFLNIGVSKFKNNYDDNAFLLERYANYAIPNMLDFSIEKLRTLTLGYVKSMNVGVSDYDFKYSTICESPNIYSSVYACMIFSMYGRIRELTTEVKAGWAQYFNKFQSPKDGLFYDKSLQNENFNNSDWWGARHLLPHLINAFIALDSRPKYPFYFLEQYYDITFLKRWIDQEDWLGRFTHSNDIDNKVMNIMVALQYQRDFWQDERAGKAVNFLQSYLLSKRNPTTGMWGYYNTEDKDEASRMVQFAYHLFTVYFYDSIEISGVESIIDYTLQTQNIYGGFGVNLNSSACEDIDSIDILIRCSTNTTYRNDDIVLALKRAFVWVLANQNEDGGFVFRRNEGMHYGHDQMASRKNESAMFPTWFRTLTIAYLSNYFYKDQFILVKSPGY